jgi:hypothetical protein
LCKAAYHPSGQAGWLLPRGRRIFENDMALNSLFRLGAAAAR